MMGLWDRISGAFDDLRSALVSRFGDEAGALSDEALGKIEVAGQDLGFDWQDDGASGGGVEDDPRFDDLTDDTAASSEPYEDVQFDDVTFNDDVTFDDVQFDSIEGAFDRVVLAPPGAEPDVDFLAEERITYVQAGDYEPDPSWVDRAEPDTEKPDFFAGAEDYLVFDAAGEPMLIPIAEFALDYEDGGGRKLFLDIEEAKTYAQEIPDFLEAILVFEEDDFAGETYRVFVRVAYER